MSIARQIIEKASESGEKITTAESCTGGMVAAALTDIAGSSAVFERGFVTYSNAAKTEMLGVVPATLEAHGAVSEEVVREMALGARAAARADVAVAISGIAGPGGSE
ncbi:MAG: nicotinamide-nucleotide amidohydrolase family protein, partial [Mameliella sp.]|nr:nicotinamide-nucleotide amidohydrolase family protein [Mameliella sp.]